MKKTTQLKHLALLAGGLFSLTAGHAQTLATGDSRTVRQPLQTPACMTLTAQFSSSQRNSPPAASADDTSRIQAALTACENTGRAVVLEASGSNDTFYSSSLNATGESLVIKSGTTLMANLNSANANSYGMSSSYALVTFTGTNSSLMGPGTVDGRADVLYAQNSAVKTSRLIQVSNFTNFIAYNVTLTMALHPHLYAQSGTGFTAWGVTIRTPVVPLNPLYGQPGQTQYDGNISGSTVTQVIKSNDGIDLDSLTNATVINSSIEAGDDGVAVKSNASNASNVTVTNNNLFGTHGLSIGSVTANTISNILFENNYVYGNDLMGTPSQFDNGITIKTYPQALNVTQVTYVNTCLDNVKHLIDFYTNYGTATSTGYVSISDVVVNGLYSENSPSSSYSAFYGQQPAAGSGNLMTVYLANVSLDATKQGSGTTADQYVTAYEYNSNETPTSTGTGVSVNAFTPTFTGSVPSCTFVAN